MGILFLCIMAAVEIGLGVVSIWKQRKRKEWLRNRFLFSGAELVIYLIMLLFPGIDFTFRFKMFFVTIIVRLLIEGLCYLIKRRKAEGNKRIGGIVCSVIFGMLFITISLVPAIIFPGYTGKPTSGQYKVGMKNVILVDESRVETFETDGSRREVPVHFYYPEDAKEGETFPAVLFSHGAFSYYESNTSTYMELASNGYVVMSLDHPYHSMFTNDTDGKLILVNMDFINSVFYINEDGTPENEIYELSSAWLDIRNADINFVLDTVETAIQNADLTDAWFLLKNNEDDILHILNHMNCDKIGVMGHSLGGSAATTIGRQREDVDAVIDLDGTMLGEQIGYENGEYIMNEEPYPVPILTLANEPHFFEGRDYGSLYVNNVVMSHAKIGYCSYIKGSGHMNYTDLPLFAPFLADRLGTGTGCNLLS